MSKLRSFFGKLINFKYAEKIGVLVLGGSATIENLHVTEIENQELTNNQRANRQELLKKVRKNWIYDVLDKSLFGGQKSIELAIKLEPDKVNPPNRNSGTGLAFNNKVHTRVIDIFDNPDGERSLLILGEPGSGKTNTLLELARELIKRAEDESKRIPLVFNLSSWKKNQKIDEWLVKELKTQYQIPEESAKVLIEQPELIVLLLDGLDEIRETDQCVDALNMFIQKPNVEIVVCCRQEDYKNTGKKLNFKSAVSLEPIILERVYRELDNTRNSLLQNLRNQIEENYDLQELAQIPLYLQLMIYIFQTEENSSAEQIKKEFIFETYRDLRFKHWKNGGCYSQEKAKSWLTWLASQMKKESEIFAIENMQPQLLSSSKAHYSAYVIVVGLIVGLLCGLSTGLLSGVLNYDSRMNLHIYQNQIVSISVGMISGLLSGLVSGLIFLLCKEIYENMLISILIGVISFVIRLLLSNCVQEDIIQLLDPFIFGLIISIVFHRIDYENINSVNTIKWSWLQAKESFKKGMLWALFSGISVLIVGIFWVFFSNSQLVEEIPWINNLLKITVIPFTQSPQTPTLDNAPLWCILALNLIFTINIWLILGTEKTIIITKKLLFMRSSRKYLVISMLIGIGMVYLIFKLVFAPNPEVLLLIYNTSREMNKILWGLLSIQLFVGLIVGIVLGFIKDANVAKAKDTIIPNYGIKRTFRNAGKLSILSTFFTISISFISWWLYHKKPDYIWWIFYGKSNSNGVWFALTVGLMVGLLSGMLNAENSGLVCIKHFILRVMLWHNKNIPWKLARLLNCATNRGLLQQVGGNYKFIHTLLQESLAKSSSSNKSGEESIEPLN
ncbi:MAG: NACHT domain-containing protein [Nostoc sp.]|uniref:NACHT domain-containing protein n=1 Tax=Nostoc sp. TaxID=1180 RepID=UPI002FF561E0